MGTEVDLVRRAGVRHRGGVRRARVRYRSGVRAVTTKAELVSYHQAARVGWHQGKFEACTNSILGTTFTFVETHVDL